MSEKLPEWDHADCPFCHGTKIAYIGYVYTPSVCCHTKEDADEQLARDLADPPAAKWERYCIQHNLDSHENETSTQYADDETGD